MARHTATPVPNSAARWRNRFGGLRRELPNVSSLTALVQSSAVVVLPYDSTDQVTSGVLVDAIASGRRWSRPPFRTPSSSSPVGRDRRRPRRPGCAGVGPAPAADRAAPRRGDGAEAPISPADAWPVVANAYQVLAHRLLAERPRSCECHHARTDIDTCCV